MKRFIISIASIFTIILSVVTAYSYLIEHIDNQIKNYAFSKLKINENSHSIEKQITEINKRIKELNENISYLKKQNDQKIKSIEKISGELFNFELNLIGKYVTKEWLEMELDHREELKEIERVAEKFKN